MLRMTAITCACCAHPNYSLQFTVIPDNAVAVSLSPLCRCAHVKTFILIHDHSLMQVVTVQKIIYDTPIIDK